jgi:ribosomal protein S13
LNFVYISLVTHVDLCKLAGKLPSKKASSLSEEEILKLKTKIEDIEVEIKELKGNIAEAVSRGNEKKEILLREEINLLRQEKLLLLRQIEATGIVNLTISVRYTCTATTYYGIIRFLLCLFTFLFIRSRVLFSSIYFLTKQ